MGNENSHPNNGLQFDEELDAICSLELLAEYLPRVITGPYHWKWVILALHNSLQGFMVLALRGTNSLNVVSKKSAKVLNKAYENRKPASKPPTLDSFMGLYRKVKSSAMQIYSTSKPLISTPAQDKSVDRLNKFRNDFVHYTPAISIFYLPAWAQIVLDVVPIIEFLTFQSNSIMFYEEQARDRVNGLCTITKKEASALLEYQDA
jgi:hypothetical protein